MPGGGGKEGKKSLLLMWYHPFARGAILFLEGGVSLGTQRVSYVRISGVRNYQSRPLCRQAIRPDERSSPHKASQSGDHPADAEVSIPHTRNGARSCRVSCYRASTVRRERQRLYASTGRTTREGARPSPRESLRPPAAHHKYNVSYENAIQKSSPHVTRR